MFGTVFPWDGPRSRPYVAQPRVSKPQPQPQPTPEFVPLEAIMVRDDNGEELGPIHPRGGAKEWRFEFCFNLADLHLGRFEVRAIQEAVRRAIPEAFAGHAVSRLVFPASHPYSVTFVVTPSRSMDSFDPGRHAVSLGKSLGGLLEHAQRLPKPDR